MISVKIRIILFFIIGSILFICGFITLIESQFEYTLKFIVGGTLFLAVSLLLKKKYK